MLWFNPPFNGEVSTNITRLFLNTIAKHFQKGTKLGKLFNKNNIKVSYSCTPNVKSIIDSHNRKVLQGKKDTSNQKLCNCQKSRKADCPLDGKCLTDNLVYRADVVETESGEKKCYYGQSMRPFKDRYNEHKTSFTTPKMDRAGCNKSFQEQVIFSFSLVTE